MPQELTFALQTAEKAASVLLRSFQRTDTGVRNTGKGVKTKNDKIADKIIISAIRKAFPSHSILTEESGRIQKDKSALWIIDPLDGTRNHQNANPFFAVSISLWKYGVPEVSIIAAPVLGELYVAHKNSAFVKNTKTGKKTKARVSSVSKIKKSYILACGGGLKNPKKAADIVYQFQSRAHDARGLGSAAIELAWVGTGRADAYITPKISIWDIAAGVHFVKNAGGALYDFKNNLLEFQQTGSKNEINLIATNGKITAPKIIF